MEILTGIGYQDPRILRKDLREVGMIELMDYTMETAVVTVDSRELAVSPGQVARYAGGSRYRADAPQLEHIHSILKNAYELVEPTFVYRIHQVDTVLAGGAVALQNGLVFPTPAEEQDPGMTALAFCVCTLGGRLEETSGRLMSAGDDLAGLFLDAAGVAFLEALSSRAYEHLQEQAQRMELRAGCRFGPGCGGLELSSQKQFFELVDASRIGVWLNESCVMKPAKSLSFATVWTSSPKPQRSPYKCASCSLIHCPYRL